MISRHWSVEYSSAGTFVQMPELATTMSSRPKSLAICWMVFSISSCSPTLALYATALTLFLLAISRASVSAVVEEL
jgi:hypothetical protein